MTGVIILAAEVSKVDSSVPDCDRLVAIRKLAFAVINRR
jgi:hypothetical protein